MSLLRAVFLAGVLFVSSSCSSPIPTEPEQPSMQFGRLGGGGIQPMCVEGCLDPDPAPSAPGIYIPGTAYSLEGCSEFGGDVDYDGLSDECEHQLALTFAPLLSFVYGDDVRRDPKYAAQWHSAGVVRVAYLLSYWMDNGAPGAPLCIPQFPGCAGHAGDSESIVLDLSYHATSQHWRVIRAYLSVHGEQYVCMESGTSLPCIPPHPRFQAGTLQFPGHPQAVPLVLVADGKHANYPTDSACDSGGHYGSDECDSPRYLDVVLVSQSNNIGSRSHPLIDGITTGNPSHPVYANQYVEYYWTSQPFRGWFSPSIPTTSNAYSAILADCGF